MLSQHVDLIDDIISIVVLHHLASRWRPSVARLDSASSRARAAQSD